MHAVEVFGACTLAVSNGAHVPTRVLRGDGEGAVEVRDTAVLELTASPQTALVLGALATHIQRLTVSGDATAALHGRNLTVADGGEVRVRSGGRLKDVGAVAVGSGGVMRLRNDGRAQCSNATGSGGGSISNPCPSIDEIADGTYVFSFWSLASGSLVAMGHEGADASISTECSLGTSFTSLCRTSRKQVNRAPLTQ